jgi:16S rRNA (adenine1518-N6/adenine1519-N6)-dimethyltransferase
VTATPKKAYGQHFLVDENILGVIGRLAGLEPEDVVLEIGPGLGVLTRFLSERVAVVHAIEVDTGLEAPLGDALLGARNVELVFADAVGFDYRSLEPAPVKLVSNLPYNIATPIIVESLYGLPSVEQWTVMVQREIADRLFADPRTKAYGAPSVLVQLHARKTGFRPVPPTVFRPRPRVESAIVAFERVSPPLSQRLRQVVVASFAYRRKTLANAISQSALATREQVEEALSAIDRESRVRAEELAPSEFLAFSEALR